MSTYVHIYTLCCTHIHDMNSCNVQVRFKQLHVPYKEQSMKTVKLHVVETPVKSSAIVHPNIQT